MGSPADLVAVSGGSQRRDRSGRDVAQAVRARHRPGSARRQLRWAIRKRALQQRDPAQSRDMAADHRRPPAHWAGISRDHRHAGLSEAIEGELSPDQREVLVALALNEVPIVVFAERLIDPGALYKSPAKAPSRAPGEGSRHRRRPGANAMNSPSYPDRDRLRRGSWAPRTGAWLRRVFRGT